MELKDNGGQVNQETRYEALQQASDVIASQADLNGVLENLVRFLPSVVSFEFLGVVLHDAERKVFRLYAFGGTLAGSAEIETEIPVAESSAARSSSETRSQSLSTTSRKRRGLPISSNGHGTTGFGRCASSLSRLPDGGSAYWSLGPLIRKIMTQRI